MNMFILQTIFLVLLAFILGLLLGRLLKSFFCKTSDEEAVEPANNRDEEIYSSYARSADKLAARSTTRDFAAEMGASAAGVAAATTTVSKDADESSVDKSGVEIDSATAVGGVFVLGGIESTNLQAIEGIGPKMESILHENEIFNWKSLANTPAESITEMLGDKYSNIADPASWIDQAGLLVDGKLEELFELQSAQDGTSKFKRMMES